MRLSKILVTSSVLIVGLTSSAAATVHFWHFEELYSNSAGSLQFIEIATSFNNQHLFQTGGNQSRLISSTPSNVVHDTFFFPNDLTTPSTANHAVLIGTSNVASVGGVVPDFVIPSGFLLPGGGRLDFVSDVFGTFSSVTYPALPVGLLSFDAETMTVDINTPKNFAGIIGQVPVPEPSSLALAALGFMGLTAWGWRRRNR